MEELNDFIRNNNISSEKQEILKKLYENNTKLFNMINTDFINSDYFENLDFNLLQAIVSLSQDVQLDFLKITDNKRNLFYQIINKFSKRYYQFPYVNSLLRNFNSGKFDSLLGSIDINILTEEDYSNLSLILTSKENVLNIQTIEEIRNIENILNQKIEHAKTNNNIEEYKNYMLLKKINLSLAETKLICQKYCYDLNHFHISNDLIQDLKRLKGIVLTNSFEEVDTLINNLNMKKIAYPDFQTMCQNLYEEEFNSVLFDPSDKDYEVYNGCRIIDAGTDFNMIIRANGALSSTDSLLPQDYWNNNIRDSLSFSTSLLSNDYLNNVSFMRENIDNIFGFSNIPKNCMVQCCMGDNATLWNRSKTLDDRSFNDEKRIHANTGDACGQQFRPLPEMIKHNAGIYPEVTLERFSYDGDSEERLQPSYVVYFKKNEDYRNNEDFKITLDAAKAFDIPVVVIDIKKVIQKSKKEIEDLVNKDLSIDNLISIIRIYANLVNSFSEKSTKYIISEFLKIEDPQELIKNLIENYLMLLEQDPHDQKFYQELFDKLMILNDEKKCIELGTLLKLKNKYNLIADFEKYGEIIYGITYKEQDKRICTQYDFEEREKAYNYIVDNGMRLTPAVYSNDKIESIIKDCRIKNIPLTQEIISYSWEEYKLYLEKIRNIRRIQNNPTKEGINELFELLSIDEIKKYIEPIRANLVENKNYFLLRILNDKLKEKNLEEIEIPEEEVEPELENFDDTTWVDFDWNNNWK